LISFTVFSISLVAIGFLSTPDSAVELYIFAIFVNGICAGAALNYTLAHLLHLTVPQTHFIVTSLIATFRGFAGSFGSAIGGGIFFRILKRSLVSGFRSRGMAGRSNLVRRLLGSPALVATLEGAEREVAIEGYVAALKALFLAASGLAMVMILIQAGTGWKEPKQVDAIDSSEEPLESNREA
jgi:hypothetical protein